jgi:uncharacterized protein YdhG (YjbR/CyaY superfamily)
LLNEEDLRSAQSKILHLSSDSDSLAVFEKALPKFYETFKEIFNTVLPEELDYDEILALAEEQLQRVYDEFARAGETFHPENPEFDDIFGRQPPGFD